MCYILTNKTKRDIHALDSGQLDMMFSFLKLQNKLQNKPSNTPEDVRVLKEHLDRIRQALIQKTAGLRKGDPDTYVSYEDLQTYINLVVIDALNLYIYGGLDVLEELLSERMKPNEDH